MLRVVEWRNDHQAALEAVLGPPDELCGQFRPLFGPPVEGPHWRVTVVAERDGAPVGAALVFASGWHPTRLWCSVEVAETHRRQGIGTTLLDAVRRRSRADGRPLRGKVFSPSPAGGFAAAQGFVPIQRSRTFRLDHNSKAADTDEDLVAEWSAAPLVAAEAFRAFYRSTHEWDPPGCLTTDDVRASHVDDAAGTVVIRDPGGAILAVGCLYDEDGTMLLSGGPTDPADPRAEAATAALLDAAPRPLLVEADDSVPTLLAVLHRRAAAVVDEVHIVAET